MDEKTYKFFAMQIDGRDAALFVTAEEAIEAICDHVAISDDETYAVSRVDGIWELICRMGAFEDYSDDWMEYVIDIVPGMVEDAKRRKEQPKDVDPDQRE